MDIVINKCYGGFGLSCSAQTMLNEIKGRELYHHDIFRHDPDLIEVIRRIGAEKASDKYSSLHIVTIPDILDYEISEYDGDETLHPFLVVTAEELANGLPQDKIDIIKNFGGAIKIKGAKDFEDDF